MVAVRSGVRKLTVYQGVNVARGWKTDFKTEMRRAMAAWRFYPSLVRVELPYPFSPQVFLGVPPALVAVQDVNHAYFLQLGR